MAIINGTFETGDFTGWDTLGDGYSVQTITKRSGSYAAKLESSGAEDEAGISQNIDATDVVSITVWYNVTSLSGTAQFRILLYDGTTTVPVTIEAATSGWASTTFDDEDIALLTDREGYGIDIQIYADTYSAGESCIGFVDDVSAEIPNYIALSGTGSTASTGIGPINGTALELAGTGATASTGTGLICGVYLVLAGTGATASTGTGRVSRYVALVGTGATDTTADAILKLFLDIENHQVLSFDSGSTAFTIGETLTGGTSGATGTVISTVLTGGTWGGGNAAGTVILGDVVGSFIDNEHLNGSVSGVNAGDANRTLSYTGPKVIRKTVSKGIDDIYATATITCRGIYGVSEVANFREVEVLLPNYLTGALDEQIFLGVVPDFGTSHSAANDTTTITAVGHMWYLANRQMPDNYLSNASWNATDEIIEYAEPSVGVTTLFGGANWNTLCGINPQHIVPVSEWGFPIPVKGWVWNKSVKRWESIRELCEYLDHFCETMYDGTLTPKGVFAPLANIDDYVPDPVTFDVDDDPGYVISINKKAQGSQKPSLVTVTGARNYRIIKFSDGVNEFTADNKLDLIDLATFTNGSDIVTTYGYLSSKLNVGDLIYDSTNDTYEDAVAIAAINLDKITLASNYAGTGGAGWNNLSKLTEGYGSILDGGTGAEAFIISFSVTSGSWAGDDAAGTLVIMPDRTGSFVAGNSIIDTRGSTYGSAKAASNDEFYELYDYYTYSYPTTEPVRAVEYFENCPDGIDSGPLIEDYAQDLYTFLQLDNNEYTVVFNKRSDLRLWQKVKVTGFDEIPEEWMRIVHINYEDESAKVIVICTLKNSGYVLSAAKMKRTARYSDEAALEAMIKKYLDTHLAIDDAEIIATEGEGYTAEIINGKSVVRVKGTET